MSMLNNRFTVLTKIENRAFQTFVSDSNDRGGKTRFALSIVVDSRILN